MRRCLGVSSGARCGVSYVVVGGSFRILRGVLVIRVGFEQMDGFGEAERFVAGGHAAGAGVGADTDPGEVGLEAVKVKTKGVAGVEGGEAIGALDEIDASVFEGGAGSENLRGA